MTKPSQLDRFETLLRSHVDALYRTALRLSGDPATAEDLVQEASLRAYRNFAAGGEPDNFRAWMFRILTNLCIDHSRRAATGAPGLTATQEVDDLPADSQGPAQALANARLGRDLTAAMAALPQDLQILVQLILVEGMTYREAAEATDCPEGTVRSRLNRARGLLRASLDKHAPGHASGLGLGAGSDRVVPFPERREKR